MNRTVMTPAAIAAALILIPATTGWAQAPTLCSAPNVKLVIGGVEGVGLDTDLPAGRWIVRTLSTDGYAGRKDTPAQLNEQWTVFVSSQPVITTTDLADGVETASVSNVAEFTTAGGVARVRHLGTIDAAARTSPNSVTVSSVCFERLPDPTPSTGPVPSTTEPVAIATIPATSLPASTFPPAPPAFPVATTTPTTTPATAPVVQTSSTVLERTTTTTAPAVLVVASTPAPTVEARPAVAVLADPSFTG